MVDKLSKAQFIMSDQTFDRREDIYAYNEFGKITNRYVLSDQVYSKEFWKYLKSNYSIKPENVTVFCDVHSDSKNRVEKMYKYIITVDKPYKLVFQFYDEEKVDKDYDTEEEKRNKITEVMVYFDYDALGHVDKLVDDVRSIVSLPEKGKTFFIISTSAMGYELMSANIKDLEIDVELNYGEEFVDKYDNILGKLKNNKHGLFLFHGTPGCGKTTLIRKLVTDLSEEKTIIYIPSYFMFDIANPELISFISKFKNSILLLEDAEMILTSSEKDRNQAVSNILNISDGLLNDHMDMQIIATFNVKRDIIDNALLRKGRLMVDYKFEKLSVEQSMKLSKHIGLNKTYTEPMTLAEIYEEKTGKQLVENETKGKKIGF